MMVGFRYLSQAHLQGFNRYKYCAVDTSPVSNYIINPFWNNVVKLMPLWVAPNLITFTGWSMVMANFFMIAYYDWDYLTTSNDLGIKRDPIPSVIWFICGIFHLVAHTLDGIDGKQARRTGSSTPLGELFDHGLDSWAAILLPMCLMSAFGRGQPWGGTVYDAFLPCLAAVAGFYLSHWEKYITGVLYLPWLYDIIWLGCGAGYLLTAYHGVQFWHFFMFPGWTVADVVKWLLILGFFGSIPISLWNIYDHYRKNSSSSEESMSQQLQPPTSTPSASGSAPSPSPSPSSSSAAGSGSSGAGHPAHAQQRTQQLLSFTEAMEPWVPFVIMAALYTVWVYLSPSKILEREPRILLFSMGVIFSNIACRLIISQMSSHRCELINLLLIPLAIAVAVSLFLPKYEAVILYTYALVAVCAHLHYGISVVGELCEHFHIHCFSLAKKEPTS